MRRWVIVVMAIALCLMPMPVEAANDEVVLMVNGEVAELDVPAQIIDGRTMVPVRFVSETLGAEVDWHSETSTVV
ncbi:MAG: copper amine oxidase N-terminal domain-containing protein, partial [Bacillota bacterium]